MNEVNILMVDDNEDDAILFREMFDDAGFAGEMIYVKGAEEAWSYLRSTEPDCKRIGIVFLDVNMPIKNGFEFLDELLHDPGFKRIPVIMISGSSRDEERQMALAKGALAYVTKPIGFDEFVNSIQSLSMVWSLSSDGSE